MSYDSTILAETALVSYWKLDETSGTTLADAVGTNPGTYQATGMTLGVAGVAGTAVTFNGSTGYATVPDSTSLHLAAPLSLEAWVKTTSTAAQIVVGKYGGTFAGYGMEVTSAGKAAFWVGDSAGGWFSGTRNVADGNWHHLVATLSGTTVLIYVDGTLDSSGTRTPSLTNTASLQIATDPSNAGTGSFNGTVDAVAVYNAALSSTAIQAHYNAVTWTITYMPPPGPLAIMPPWRPLARGLRFLASGPRHPGGAADIVSGVAGTAVGSPTTVGTPWGAGYQLNGAGYKVIGRGYAGNEPPSITLFCVANASGGNVSGFCHPIRTSSTNTGYAIEMDVIGNSFYLNLFGVTNYGTCAQRSNHWNALAAGRDTAGNFFCYGFDYDIKLLSSSVGTGATATAAAGDEAAALNMAAQGNVAVAVAGFTPTPWTLADFQKFAADPLRFLRPVRSAVQGFYATGPGRFRRIGMDGGISPPYTGGIN